MKCRSPPPYHLPSPWAWREFYTHFNHEVGVVNPPFLKSTLCVRLHAGRLSKVRGTQRMGHPQCGEGQRDWPDVLFTQPLRLRSVWFGYAVWQDAKDGAPTVW